MQSKAFDDFLERMKNAGYEIKQGKYLAVKPKFSRQFIRLKSLGESYSEQALRNRINEKKSFEKQTENKISSAPADSFELLIYKTVRQYTVVFAQDVLPVRRTNNQKYFSWRNARELQKIFGLNAQINSGNFSVKKIKSDFESAGKRLSDKENKISALRNEINFFADLEIKAKFVFENALKSPLKIDRERAYFDEAKKTLSAQKITKENYFIISQTAAKSRAELSSLEKQANSEREKLKNLSELMTFADEIRGGTYVQKLVNAELERRRAGYAKGEI